MRGLGLGVLVSGFLCISRPSTTMMMQFTLYSSHSLYDDLDGGFGGGGGGGGAAGGGGEGDLYGDLVEAAAAEEAREDPQEVLRCVFSFSVVWWWWSCGVWFVVWGIGAASIHISPVDSHHPPTPPHLYTKLSQPHRRPRPARPPADAPRPPPQGPRAGRGPLPRRFRPGGAAPLGVIEVVRGL